jgi:hypothetical protein
MSRVFSPTRYVILIRCKAEREFAFCRRQGGARSTKEEVIDRHLV